MKSKHLIFTSSLHNLWFRADPSINELLNRFDLPEILKETLIKCIREGNTSSIDPLLYQLDGEEQRELATSLLAPKDNYPVSRAKGKFILFHY